MPKLIVNKAGVYNTRRLQAGDSFLTNGPTARLLVALGKAKFASPADEPKKRVHPRVARAELKAKEPEPTPAPDAMTTDSGLVSTAVLNDPATAGDPAAAETTGQPPAPAAPQTAPEDPNPPAPATPWAKKKPTKAK